MKKLLKKILRKTGFKVERYEVLPYNKRIIEIYEVFSDLISIIEKNSIKGVFVECGFGYGRSFSVLSHFAIKLKRKIYGFDSFSGFPNVLQVDYSSRNPKNGEWSVRTLKEANKFISSTGLFKNDNEFSLQKLVFDENAKNLIPKEKIAFLHIDLDLYEGYKYSLEIFFDQVQIGGIILFDEYNLVKWPGATSAINDFLTKRGLSYKQLNEVRGKYFLIKT